MVVTVLLAAGAAADEPVEVLYFGADGCPHCAAMEDDLAAMERALGDTVAVQRFEVSGDPAARQRWVRELAQRGHEPTGVPTIILTEQVLVGYDPGIVGLIEAHVRAKAAESSARDEVADPPPPSAAPEGVADARAPSAAPEGVAHAGASSEADRPAERAGTQPSPIRLPLVGEVTLAGRSAIGATALIALVDGFNPCSLWVLSVLLAMVLHAGASRGRVALIGGVFLTVTGLLYGAFIAGVFSVMGLVEHLGVIRFGVAAIALTVGLINVKDYLWFKRGVSLTIPDRVKPRIYRTTRDIRRTDRSLPAVLGTTVAMAAGIALVELPCTAGFPVVWSGIMHQQQVAGAEFLGLLGLYLGIYVLDELVLFLAVVWTLRIARFQERHGRLLKLLGGTVMLALGTVLLVAPGVMADPVLAAGVVAGAIAIAVALDRSLRAGSTEHARAQPSPSSAPSSALGGSVGSSEVDEVRESVSSSRGGSPPD